MSTTGEQAAKLLEGTTPDWTVYSEPEVGLPPSLFAGAPGREGFAPLEPLQGRDLNLAQAAPDLAAALIASEAARKLAEERLAEVDRERANTMKEEIINENNDSLRTKLNDLYNAAIMTNNLQVASQVLSTLLALEMSVK